MRRVRRSSIEKFATLVRCAAVVAVLLCFLPSPESWRDRPMALEQISRIGDVLIFAPAGKGSKFLGAMSIDAAPPDLAAREEAMALVGRELSIYPPGFLRKCGVRQVVICGGLELGRKTIGGTVDFDSGRIYLRTPEAFWPPNYAPKAIHHELFHLLDYYDDRSYSDPEWEKLNLAGFHYGGGGFAMPENPAALLPDASVPGFLNAYSRSGIEEDKAEVFSQMIYEPEVLAARMTSDPILAAKHRALKAFLQQTSPELGDQFWAMISRRPGRL